jgi:methionyl-tRNA synthetase
VISSSLERYRFREALGEMMNVARLEINIWLMKNENDKTDAGRVQTQMYGANFSSFYVHLEPFLPLHQLNYQEY